MGGEELAVADALLDFVATVLQGLAHLVGHQGGEGVLALAQQGGGAAHGGGALSEASPAPVQEGGVGGLGRLSGLRQGGGGIAAARRSRGGIDGLQVGRGEGVGHGGENGSSGGSFRLSRSAPAHPAAN